MAPLNFQSVVGIVGFYKVMLKRSLLPPLLIKDSSWCSGHSYVASPSQHHELGIAWWSNYVSSSVAVGGECITGNCEHWAKVHLLLVTFASEVTHHDSISDFSVVTDLQDGSYMYIYNKNHNEHHVDEIISNNCRHLHIIMCLKISEENSLLTILNICTWPHGIHKIVVPVNILTQYTNHVTYTEEKIYSMPQAIHGRLKCLMKSKYTTWDSRWPKRTTSSRHYGTQTKDGTLILRQITLVIRTPFLQVSGSKNLRFLSSR